MTTSALVNHKYRTTIPTPISPTFLNSDSQANLKPDFQSELNTGV